MSFDFAKVGHSDLIFANLVKAHLVVLDFQYEDSRSLGYIKEDENR